MRMHDSTLHDMTMDRRSFIKLSGLLGLSLASTGVFTACNESVRFNDNLYKVSRTRLAMGSFVSMTLVHPSKDQAEDAMGLAFNEVDRLAKLMSRFEEGTVVPYINERGRGEALPPEVVHVFRQALHYHELTEGAFDITVKPVIDLFVEKLGGEKKAFPTEKEIKQVQELVGSERIAIKGDSISFERQGMGVTLDGIAVGYIVDRASEILTERGIQNHLINAGGDIRTKGCRADRRPWAIAIEDPMKRHRYPDITPLNDGAISTSGNYEVYFDHDKLFHHIVNPKTCLSPDLSTSVSVIARSTTEADALSTSVFVMNPVKGTEFINSMPGCESLIIAQDGSQIRSKGWKSAAI